MKLITILLLCFELLTAQDRISYLNKANQAEFEFVNGNVFAANKIFKQLQKNYKDLNTKDYFYSGIACYLLKDTLRGYDFLHIGFNHFNTIR